LHVYAANHSGIYQYVPSSHSIVEISQGDRRIEISKTVDSDGVMISSASWILISFLDTEIGNPNYPAAWYYEAGAIAHNIFLESTALKLSATAIYNIVDDVALRSALGLSSQTNLVPLLIIPTGRTTPSNPPDPPDLFGPNIGRAGITYKYSSSTIDPDGDQVSYLFDWGDGKKSEWTEFVDSGVEITASHSWGMGKYIIKVKSRDIHGAESQWSDPLSVSMPKNKQETKIFFSQFVGKLIDKFPQLPQLFQILVFNKILIQG
jgi:hypothetical protein